MHQVIWAAEVIELEKLYKTLNDNMPMLGKEIEPLIKTNDANVVLLYARRSLEVIVTELCETELKRPRKTEPLKGIIDKLGSEDKVPSNIVTSMHSLNSLATFGTHPKDFDPEQVKPVLSNLSVVIKWYLKFKAIDISLLSSVKNVLITKKGVESDTPDISQFEKSVAILPFRNDSPNEENTYFINGVMEEILNNLQKIRDIRVISRTSVEQYRNQTKPIPEIAKELGVNYLVEGSAQKYGSNFRLRAQLIMAEKETHLWGESFQQNITEVEDIFNIQIQIAESIAEELKAVISPGEKKLIEKIPVADIEVYDEYLKARSYWADFTKESLYKAVEYLNRAIEKNPNWAPLYAGLAEVWIWIQQAGWEQSSVAGPIIFQNLNKAMELDPDLAEVHYQCAVSAQLVEWDWGKSEKEFLKALAINPNNSLSRLMYAQLLLILNRPDESIAQRELAISLDPLNPVTKLIYMGTLIQAGECKASLSLLEEAWATNPVDLNYNALIEIAAYMCKDFDRVIRSLRYALPFPFEEDNYKEIERIYRESGIVSAYEELMKYMEKFAYANYIGFFDMTFRYIIANQFDKAMDWIEKGFDSHDPLMSYITQTAHILEPLFGNPRFIAICEKMNLQLSQN
jgi:TolB-like protein